MGIAVITGLFLGSYQIHCLSLSFLQLEKKKDKLLIIKIKLGGGVLMLSSKPFCNTILMAVCSTSSENKNSSVNAPHFFPESVPSQNNGIELFTFWEKSVSCLAMNTIWQVS